MASRIVGWSLAPAPIGRREAVWMLLPSFVLPWLFFGSHVRVGGFFSDNWAGLATSKFLLADSAWGRIADCLNGSRILDNPVSCVSYQAIYSVAGEHAKVWASLTLVLFGVVLWMFYLVLRRAALPPLLALAPFALVMVYDGADSMRLWYMTSALIMLIFFFGALLAGAQSCSARRRFTALLWGAGALGLFALSAASYQTIVPVVLLLPAYAWWCSRRVVPSATLGALAVMGVGVIGFFRASGSGRVATTTAGGLLDKAALVYEGASDNWAIAYLGLPLPPSAVVVLLLVAAGIAWVLTMPGGRQVWVWATVLAVGGALVALLGVTAFVPAEEYYVPRTFGLDNRMNVVAQFGYAMVAAGLYTYIGLIAYRLFSRRWLAVAVGAVLVATASFHSLQRSFESKALWADSWRQQVHILGTINRLVPQIRSQEMFLTAGHSLYEVNWLPIFAQAWELEGAVKLARSNPSASGYPLAGWECATGGWARAGAPTALGSAGIVPYSRVHLVDVRGEGRAMQPRTLSACREAVKESGGNPTI